MGTHVISGSGKAVIVNLAKDSEFGKITESLDETETDTDFERGIKDFGNLILQVTTILIGLIFCSTLFSTSLSWNHSCLHWHCL